jgi:hypothetical protein
MELWEAQSIIKDAAFNIRRHGLAAEPPNQANFIMATILVLEDLMQQVEDLKPEEPY